MSYLTEAFRQLDLNEDMFSLDLDGVEAATDMLDKSDRKDDITVKDVFDTDAKDDSELKSSYIGQVIIECPICRTLLYKNKEDISLSEDGDMAVIDDCCPVCLSEEGFKIIGQVANFDFNEDSDIDVTIDGEEVEVEDSEEESEDDDLEESLKNHSLKEARKAKVKIRCKRRKLQEKKWDYQLKCGKALRQAIEDEDYVTIKDLLIKAWTELEDYFNDDYSSDIESIKYISLDDYDAEDELNYALDDLYDFCDNMNVWIPLLVEESLHEEKSKSKTKDLTTTKRTISYEFTKPDNHALLTSILDDYSYWKDKRDKLIDLINTLDVSEATKADTIQKLRNLKNEGAFYSTVGTYILGEKVLPASSSMNEGFNEVSVTTDGERLEMTQDPDTRKVTVTTEPIEENSEDSFGEDETLVALDSETEETIKSNSDAEVEDEEDSIDEESTDEEISEEEPTNEETSEEDIQEFDEESFDKLGESYLRNVYDNVKSYKTTSVKSTNPNQLIIEGIIKFTSGNQKATKFMFEANRKTPSGKLRFIGENLNITRGKKSFIITGRNKAGKFLSESLNYNYMVEGNKVRGRVKR